MSNPKEHVVEAFANQGEARYGYVGVDNWQNGVIPEGTRIAQIEWRNPADATAPYSRYFTNIEEIEALTGPDGRVDVGALSERLQVQAHGGQYNAAVSIYEVTEDMPVARAMVTDNTALGRGGAEQFFAPDEVKSGQYLEKVDQLETTNRTPRLPIYEEMAQLSDKADVENLIDRYNDAYIDALEQSGDPKALDVADAMEERQAFSDIARDIADDPEAVRSVDLPSSTATNLDLAPETARAVEAVRDESLGHSPDRPPSNLDEANRFQQATDRIVEADAKGELRSFAADPDGHTSHLIDTKNSTIYTVEEGRLTGVQKFDSSQDAGHAFGRMMSEAAQTYPGTFKGLPSVHNSLGSLGNHIDELASPAWRRALGTAGDTVADIGGKASKILGPLGVAAAGAEAYSLEMKLQDYEEFGLVPEEAMLAYRGILTGHTAQATLDPTLLGGEIPVQLAHDEWAKAYGISPDVAEALEPGSLLEDLDAAKDWLEARALEAGEAVADYATSRWDNPDLIKDDLERAGDALVDAGEYVVDKTEDAVDAVSDYASSRWDDPSKLGDDVEAIGDSIGDAAQGAWNWLMGNDEPSELEQSLKGGETDQPVRETVPFGDAVQQFVDDREILREIDPQQELTESKLAEYPEAENLFVRLHDDGITRFPKDAIEGDTPQERVGNTLTQARTIDRDLSVNRTVEAEADLSIDPAKPNFVEEYDYSSGI